MFGIPAAGLKNPRLCCSRHDHEAEMESEGKIGTERAAPLGAVERRLIGREGERAYSEAEINRELLVELNLDTASKIEEPPKGIDREAISKERDAHRCVEERMHAPLAQAKDTDRISKRLHRADLVERGAVD